MRLGFGFGFGRELETAGTDAETERWANGKEEEEVLLAAVVVVVVGGPVVEWFGGVRARGTLREDLGDRSSSLEDSTTSLRFLGTRRTGILWGMRRGEEGFLYFR